MLPEDSTWLEVLLRKHLKEKGIAKVLNIEYENAVPVGNNYLSKILRVKLDVITETGQKIKKTVIFKKMIGDDLAVFKIEYNAYKNVLEYFDQVMDEYDDTNDKLWCDMLGYRPYDLLIFEDLNAQNFKSLIRQNLLDLNHANLVMHSLGRLHALGFVLFQNGLIERSNFVKHYLEVDTPIMRQMTAGGLKMLSDVMKKDWPLEWEYIAQKLAEEQHIVMEKIQKLFQIEEDCFMTINHGDVWTCNLLFQYCPYNDKIPVAMKFIDFQAVNGNSFIFDIVTFLYTSVEPEIRRTNLDQLFLTYLKSLRSTLSIYGMEDKTPTLEQLYNEKKRVDYFSFVICVTQLPIVCSPLNEPINLENISADYNKKSIYVPEVFNGDKFKKIIKEDLMDWMLLDIF